jgi:hypothetical protein
VPPKADNSDLVETEQAKPYLTTDEFTNIKAYIQPPKLNIKDCLTPSVIAVN